LWRPEKRESVVQLIRNLQSKGVHIDGIGLQGHWGLDYPPLDELEASILAYANLDVKVMITELDLNILPLPAPEMGADIALNFELQKELNPYPEQLPDSMQEKLANRYAELFMVLNKHHNYISRVTLWGVHDGQSWSNNWPVKGRTAYPLLFDRKFQPKSAFYAVIKTAEK
jgi:endo-1,4-beta-xylanase